MKSSVMQHQPSTGELMKAIVDLHAAVSSGFSRVDERFSRVDERFDRLEGRVGSLEYGSTAIRAEVSGLQRWMVQSDRRFEALERPS